MQKPMNPSEEKKHMKQISIPLFSPAIAPERARSRRSRLRGFVMCFVINEKHIHFRNSRSTIDR